MIGLSTKQYNLAGHWILHPSPRNADQRKVERRISRTATLDGGAVITDQGYSAGDRTFKYEFKDLDAETIGEIEEAVKFYSEFVLCCEAGAFFVTPQTFDYRGGILSLVLLASGAA